MQHACSFSCQPYRAYKSNGTAVAALISAKLERTKMQAAACKLALDFDFRV